MSDNLFDTLKREFIYLWFYFDVQLRQIFWYWIIGMAAGSCVSVFFKGKLSELCSKAGQKLSGVAGWVFAAALGTASPLCMYGTIPIAASFAQQGISEGFLAAFMMSSILLNPQLIVYSAALGPALLAVRIASCLACGIAAGALVSLYTKKSGKSFFSFEGITGATNRDTDPRIPIRLLKNFWRNIKATGPYFLLGVLLAAVFQRYVPAGKFAALFGKNEGFGILFAATVGVPLYVCGGGTIPLMIQWLADGMTYGAAAAFMITGPAAKITNLGALKIVLGSSSFACYLAFAVLFSLLAGLIVSIIW